jgi:glyceraldehyde-3-phosphate dehydrogenase (ferredoxin)
MDGAQSILDTREFCLRWPSWENIICIMVKIFYHLIQLGQENAKRMLKELMLDNLGFCRFHRAWAEDIMPDIVEKLFGYKDVFLRSLSLTASRINSRNASIFWEPERNIDIVWSFLKRKKEVDGVQNDQLEYWLKEFTDNKHKAALDFWYEMHKGIHESLREFPD